MPGAITVLHGAMSDYVGQLLQNYGMRPLNDGYILLGREHCTDTRAPNSIVFVPIGTRFARSQLTSTSDLVALSPNQGKIARLRSRALASRAITFEVHVWGAATPDSPYNDWDVIELLYETVVRASYLIASSDAQWSDGEFIDQRPDDFEREKLGHYFVFHLAFDGPVVDNAVNLVPHGTKLNPLTLNMNPGAP